jgi:hypothetical protein
MRRDKSECMRMRFNSGETLCACVCNRSLRAGDRLCAFTAAGHR